MLYEMQSEEEVEELVMMAVLALSRVSSPLNPCFKFLFSVCNVAWNDKSRLWQSEQQIKLLQRPVTAKVDRDGKAGPPALPA